MKVSLLLWSLLFAVVLSLYSPGSTSVQILTTNTFKQVYKGIWLVQFYAPWCGHCKNLAPEYEKAAKGLKGIANIGAVDATKENVGISISGYPTIKWFVDGKASDYNGERNAKGIIDFILSEYKKIAQQRIGMKNSGGGSQSGDNSNHDDKDVIVLTDDNFDSMVMQDESAWFVEFYAPWCGHCKNLAPEWAALATNLKGQVKVAKIDATQNKQLGSRFGVSGYPTIKFFPTGVKSDDQAITYSQGRSESIMAQWARQQTKDSAHFEHNVLNSQLVYDQMCKGRNLCIISFLPHILDSSEEERTSYLDIIKSVGLKFRGKPFKMLWVQGGDQYEFQDKLGVLGIGYPAVVAIFETKKLFGRLKRSFSQQNFENFLTDIMSNKAKFISLMELPKLKTIKQQQNNLDGQKKSQDKGCDEDKCTGPPPDEQL